MKLHPCQDLYDEFTHGTMGRRRFFNRLVTLAGGTAAASALLPLLENNYAAAQIVAESDARITAETDFQALFESIELDQIPRGV